MKQIAIDDEALTIGALGPQPPTTAPPASSVREISTVFKSRCDYVCSPAFVNQSVQSWFDSQEIQRRAVGAFFFAVRDLLGTG